MSWQEEVFGPLLARTMENAQVHHLAEQYDLSRDSNLALAIVRYTNSALDGEEKRRQIERVRPGEVLLRTRRGPLVLSLRTPEDIARVVAGERWDVVRRDILARCEARYRELFPEVTPGDTGRFLRCLWQGRGPRSPEPSPLHGPRRQRPWGSTTLDGTPLAELDAERARGQIERDPPRPGHRPETLQKLTHFLNTQAGIPPAVQEPMLLDLVATRARFCPRLTTLASGQMPLAAMHVESGRTLWQATRYQPMAPVVVTLLAGDETCTLRHHPPKEYEQFMVLALTLFVGEAPELHGADGTLGMDVGLSAAG